MTVVACKATKEHRPKTTRKRKVFLGLTAHSAVKIVLSVDRGPADGLAQGFARFLALKARYIIAQAEGLGSFAPPGFSSSARTTRTNAAQVGQG